MTYTIEQLKKGVIVDTQTAKLLRSQYRDSYNYSIVPDRTDKWIFRLESERVYIFS